MQAFPSSQSEPAATAQVPVDAEHGLQTPHAEPEFCHEPLLLQTWGCDPAHCFAPGTHVPVQAPVAALHTKGQAEPEGVQVPFASQSWGCNPLHCFAPGVQVPVHVPDARSQTKGHAVPMFCQAPELAHT